MVMNNGEGLSPLSDISPGSSLAEKATDDSPAEVLAQRQAFLGITELDVVRVRRLEPLFRSFMDDFVREFYAHLFSFPQTAALLQNQETAERLKGVQKSYLLSLLRAELDPALVEERRRIGHAHAEVGLEPEWFLGAYNHFVQLCFRRYAECASQNMPEYVQGTLSLIKFIFMDIGLALDAYFGRSTELLRKALELYEQSNADLREFAHLASHDLKTPLATVSALCEEFLDEFGGQVPAEASKLIEAARARTMKMKDMIDELLSMSEAAAQPVQRAYVSTRSLLDTVIERIRLEIGDRDIRLEIPAQLPRVMGHPAHLREVFYQLLSNSVKFMDKSPGIVRIAAHKTDSECVFCVSDNGPGIAQADQQKIFAPFQRLSHHRDLPGTGLGLYFVRRIVEQRGGRVWVDSKVGEGSRFYVAIPVLSRETAARSHQTV